MCFAVGSPRRFAVQACENSCTVSEKNRIGRPISICCRFVVPPSQTTFRRRQESLSDDVDWPADPAGKDSCRRASAAFFRRRRESRGCLISSFLSPLHPSPSGRGEGGEGVRRCNATISLNILNHRDRCSQLYSNLWDNLSLPDDVDWPADPAGKDSCRRASAAFSTVPSGRAHYRAPLPYAQIPRRRITSTTRQMASINAATLIFTLYACGTRKTISFSLSAPICRIQICSRLHRIARASLVHL